MLTICLLTATSIYVSHREIEEWGEIPAGWVVAKPPEDLSKINQRQGASWVVLNEAPEPKPQPHKPIQISRIDFTRLFTGAQQAKINAFRKACAALTPEDYADPSAGLLIQLEIVFQQFDLPAEFIELNHPDTRLGLELLAYAGVFGEDPSSALAEVERILTGIPLS